MRELAGKFRAVPIDRVRAHHSSCLKCIPELASTVAKQYKACVALQVDGFSTECALHIIRQLLDIEDRCQVEAGAGKPIQGRL